MSISKFVIFFIINNIFFTLLISHSTALWEGEPEKNALYYYHKGLLQYENEMYDYSIENMEKAADRDGSLYTALNVLGHIYVIKHKRDRAIKYYNDSLLVNNNQPDIHCAIGELYEFFSENELAFRHFIESVKLDSKHLKSNLNLVRFYIIRNEKGAAERHFRASNAAGIEKSRLVYEKAKEELKKKNYRRAVTLLEKSIKENPSLVEAYIDLFHANRYLDDHVHAAEIMERLKFIKPDYEMAYVNLGHIYFEKKFSGKKKYYIDLAIRNYMKALELNPASYETCYSLSMIYYSIGNYARGREYENMGLEIEKVAGNTGEKK